MMPTQDRGRSRKRRRISEGYVEEDMVDEGGDDYARDDQHRSPPSSSSLSPPSSTISSSARSHPSSPIRECTTMNMLDPVLSASLDKSTITRLPPDMQTLLRLVRACAEGEGVVPEELKCELRRDSPRAFRYDHYFYAPDSARARSGRAPTFVDIDRLSSRASECSLYLESEAGWNSLVHGPLLDLAQHLSRVRPAIDVANMSPARLLTRLYPRFAPLAPPPPTQLLDFAILLQRNAILDEAYFALPLEPGEEAKTHNPTMHYPTLMRPIAVGIATKREGEGRPEGETQLAVWVSAHFQWLEELRGRSGNVGPGGSLTALPVILVQGPIWPLWVAMRDGKGRTTLYSQLDFGDATTEMGVFKIISVLLHLFEWCETVYRPWFEANCLAAI